LYPYHLHAGQAHFFELNEKWLVLKPRYFACDVPANIVLILSKTPIKVAGQDLGVFPILL
jgi:hypothetical protein